MSTPSLPAKSTLVSSTTQSIAFWQSKATASRRALLLPPAAGAMIIIAAGIADTAQRGCQVSRSTLYHPAQRYFAEETNEYPLSGDSTCCPQICRCHRCPAPARLKRPGRPAGHAAIAPRSRRPRPIAPGYHCQASARKIIAGALAIQATKRRLPVWYTEMASSNEAYAIPSYDLAQPNGRLWKELQSGYFDHGDH